MKRVAVLLFLLTACSAPRPIERGAPAAPDSPEIRVTTRGDVQVLDVGVQQGDHGLELAGRFRLRWPALPAERTARVVARDAGGIVVLDRLVVADVRPMTLRHKGAREAAFRLALADPALAGDSIRSLEISVPGASEP